MIIQIIIDNIALYIIIIYTGGSAVGYHHKYDIKLA